MWQGHSVLVDVDGAVVALDPRSFAALSERLQDEAIDWELTGLLADLPERVRVPVAELAPLRLLLGRWHADDGALRDDLRALLGALTVPLPALAAG